MVTTIHEEWNSPSPTFKYYSSLLPQVISKYRETISFIDAINLCVSSETLEKILFQCSNLKTLKLDNLACDAFVPSIEGETTPIEHLEISYLKKGNSQSKSYSWLTRFRNLQTVRQTNIANLLS